MGVAGAKPRLASLKVLTGGASPHATMAARVEPLSPKEPKWSTFLGSKTVASREAAAFWAEIVPTLEAAGVLSRLDSALLIEACTCWGRIQQMEREITKGYKAESLGNRRVAKAPALTAINQYRAAFKFYVGELGLSPSSRARMAIPKADEDELDLD